TSFGLEREHYDVAFYALAVRNAARFVEPVLAAPPETRPDWRVLLELGIALNKKGGGRRELRTMAAMRALRLAGPRRTLDGLLRLGPHRLSLKKLQQSPHGIDLGPLEPRLPALLPNGRINLAPQRFVADLARLEAQLGAPADGLRLIGRRQLRSNNSWMHNALRLVKGPAACTLRMNPDDARARGLAHGQSVRVRSRVGEVVVPLELSDEMGRGVVSLPHGWGHERPGVALAIAGAHAGASVNDLTDEAFLDALSGNASLNGVPVEVCIAGDTAAVARA